MKTTKRKREPATTPEKAKGPTGRAKAAQESTTARTAAPTVEAAASVQPSAAAASKSAPNSLVLSSICSVREAAALKDSLSQLLELEEVTVDTANLERIDTATVQLLCAFVRDRAKANRKVTWAGESATLRDAARLLGVADMLALPPGAAA
jgi:ABC-type transporter Mla MlaB component